jgi:hypothetical protein
MKPQKRWRRRPVSRVLRASGARALRLHETFANADRRVWEKTLVCGALPVDSLKNFIRSLFGAASLVALLLAFNAAPAAASACGQRVLDDWYDDGNVATTYPIHCYREAIADLPEDVQSYSSAEDDISAAMLAAIAANEQDKKDDGGTSTNGKNSSGAGGTKSGGGGKGPDGIAGTSDDVDPGGEMDARSGADANQTGPVTQAMDKIGPSRADSFPLALVIVGLLGLLLLAAGGASFIKQRARGRRLPPARRI